jgi:alpha-tubulin suppressor-like RCC1 family protein
VGACSYWCNGGAWTQSSNTCAAHTYQLSTNGSGAAHMCLLKRSTGAAYCWGDNQNDQLGTGNTATSYAPVPVTGGLNLTSISVGGVWIPDTSCGVTTSGAAYCWGENQFGQLGSGTKGTAGDAHAPTLVAGGLSFSQVVAGEYSSCGLTTAGAAYCWGDNTYGNLGNGSTTSSLVPVAVTGGLVFKQIITSFGQNYCALTTAGAAHCWGWNGAGVLGNGTGTDSPAPVPVSGGNSFTSITGGYQFACGLTATGAAYCWGKNDWGQLGATTPDVLSSTPVAVTGGRTFTSLTAGTYHMCGIVPGGAAYCWGGTPTHHVLGNNDATPSGLPTPVLVSGGYSFSQLAAGYDFTCGLTGTSGVVCWGTNYHGDLGNGGLSDASVPASVINLP